jgi:hypothetical protein
MLVVNLQAIAGVYQNVFTAGVGWAGSISNIGFKGEAAFYADQKDSASRLVAPLEGDYVFKNGWYLSSSFCTMKEACTKEFNAGKMELVDSFLKRV